MTKRHSYILTESSPNLDLPAYSNGSSWKPISWKVGDELIREEFCFCPKCKSLFCGGGCSVQEVDCSYEDFLPHNRKLETWTYTYNAISDGESFCYRNEDELKEYGSLGILNPASVSLINLFINGVLQPRVIYEVTKGCLKLKVNTPPPKDAPVILQFIAFYDSFC